MGCVLVLQAYAEAINVVAEALSTNKGMDAAKIQVSPLTRLSSQCKQGLEAPCAEAIRQLSSHGASRFCCLGYADCEGVHPDVRPHGQPVQYHALLRQVRAATGTFYLLLNPFERAHQYIHAERCQSFCQSLFLGCTIPASFLPFCF